MTLLAQVELPSEGREHKVLCYIVQNPFMCSLASAILHIAQREGVYLFGTLLFRSYREVLPFRNVRLIPLVKKKKVSKANT